MTALEYTLDRIMTVMELAFDPAFGEAWNRRQVADALTMPTTHALVVNQDGEPIEADQGNSPLHAAGFALTRAAPGEEELLLIGVLPEFRRRGLGEKLIEQLLIASRSRGAERLFLEMRRGNPAIHLYEKMGFEPIGERRNYYKLANGERIDAITFGRTI